MELKCSTRSWSETVTLHLTHPRGTVWRISLVLMVGETGVPGGNTCKHVENMQTLHRKSHNKAFWVLALITLLVGQFNIVEVIFSKWKSEYMVNVGLNNMTVPNKTLDQIFAQVYFVFLHYSLIFKYNNYVQNWFDINVGYLTNCFQFTLINCPLEKTMDWENLVGHQVIFKR